MGRTQAMQGQINSVQQMESQAGTAAGLPVTGQPAYFLNTGGYFMNNRVGGGPAAPRPMARPLMTTPPAAPGVRTR